MDFLLARQWADAAEANDQAVKNMRQPSRDVQLRLVAALLNVEDGGPRARAVPSGARATLPSPRCFAQRGFWFL